MESIVRGQKQSGGSYEGRRVKPCHPPTYVGGNQKGQSTGHNAAGNEKSPAAKRTSGDASPK